MCIMKTIEEKAKEHAQKVWGVYVDDEHPEVHITLTHGEISELDFIEGYKQAQKQLYSEKEVLELLLNCPYEFRENIKEWFNQNKKK